MGFFNLLWIFVSGIGVGAYAFGKPEYRGVGLILFAATLALGAIHGWFMSWWKRRQ
jgi:hypothetical protein